MDAEALATMKATVLSSPDWATLLATLEADHAVVNGLSLKDFDKLSVEDQNALLDAIEGKVRETDSFKKVEQVLDAEINKATSSSGLPPQVAAMKMLSVVSSSTHNQALHANTLASQFTACSPTVQSQLRSVVWSNCLRLTPEQESRFQASLSTEQRKMISKLTTEVFQQACEEVLQESVATLSPTQQQSLMHTVELWYRVCCHCQHGSGVGKIASSKAIAVDINMLNTLTLLAYGQQCHDTTATTDHIRLAWAVETILQSLNIEELYETMFTLLRTHDRTLLEHVQRLNVTSSNPLAGFMIEDDVVKLFAGLLPLESCLFIADRCITSGFSGFVNTLATLCVALFMCCRSDLLRTSSVERLSVSFHAAIAFMPVSVLSTQYNRLLSSIDENVPVVMLTPHPPDMPRPNQLNSQPQGTETAPQRRTSLPNARAPRKSIAIAPTTEIDNSIGHQTRVDSEQSMNSDAVESKRELESGASQFDNEVASVNQALSVGSDGHVEGSEDPTPTTTTPHQDDATAGESKSDCQSTLAWKLLEGVTAYADQLKFLLCGDESTESALMKEVRAGEELYTNTRASVQKSVFGWEVTDDELAHLSPRRLSVIEQKADAYKKKFVKQYLKAKRRHSSTT